MKRISFTLCILLYSLVSYSQLSSKEFWTVTDLTTSNKEFRIKANHYQLLHLKEQSFKAILPTVHKQIDDKSWNNTVVIELPTPDNGVASFRIQMSEIMDISLEEKYSGIRTFNGQGITDPRATIVLDYNVMGVHAMVLSPFGDYFIDPAYHGNTSEYLVYYKKDLLKQYSFKEEPYLGRAPIIQTNTADNVVAVNCSGTTLRKYRCAIACTGEYAQAACGYTAGGTTYPTKAQVMSAVQTTFARVVGVYEKELSITMTLVAKEDTILFVNPNTDPFTGNNNANTLITESQTNIVKYITSANFDIGHTFSTGGGGLAGLGVVCQASQKASGITGSPTPTGDGYDIDYVAHEMGHEFGGNHTFNDNTKGSCAGNYSSIANNEPGSGSTIMAYAGICTGDDLQPHSDPIFTAISYKEIKAYTTTGAGKGCAVSTTTTNHPPVVALTPDYTIPFKTPFTLTGSATDVDGDSLTYCWEQINVGGTACLWNAPKTTLTLGDAPIFRSFNPVVSGTRYFPRLRAVIKNADTVGEIMPSYARTLKFRLTARDNKNGSGGVCYNENNVIVANTTTAFSLKYPITTSTTWKGGTNDSVTWNVSSTNLAPINCAKVSIDLSVDGGYTYSYNLIDSTDNTGSCVITVPNINTTTARVRVRAVGNIFYNISTANFKIIPCVSTSSTTNYNICSNLFPYTWNGVVINAAGTYVAHLTNKAGCDSAATLVLTSSDPSASTTNISACNSYIWNGVTYTASGSYTKTFSGGNAKGCDSIATLNLTINKPTSSTTNVTGCISYLWNGTTYTNNGTYTKTFVGGNVNGCDSTATLNLILSKPTTSTSNVNAYDSFTFKGKVYKLSTVIHDTVRSVSGCDSIYTIINLTIKNLSAVTINTYLFGCDSLVQNGKTYKASTVYIDTIKTQPIASSNQGYNREGFNTASNFITSSVDPSLIMGSVVVTYQKSDSSTWAFYGAYRTTGSNTCVSYSLGHVRFLKYQDGTTPWLVTPVVMSGISELHFTPVGSNKRFKIQWTADTAATTSNWTTLLDSVVVTTCKDTAIKINQATAKRVRFLDINLSTGYQVDFDSIWVTKFNVVHDSIYNYVNIIINKTTAVRDTIKIMGNNSVVYNGISYTNSTLVKDTVKTTHGCDSIYHIVYITINQSTVVTQSNYYFGCNSFVYNGKTYNNSITIIDTLKGYTGLDSVYYVAIITIQKLTATTKTTTLKGCGSVLYNNKVYTSSINFTDTIKSVLGCDSIYNITSIIVYKTNPITNVINLSGCNSVTYNSKIYTLSTVVKDTIKNINGCDSIYKVANITVNKLVATVSTINITGCNSVNFNGINYTSSTTVNIDTLFSIKGCDSIYHIAKIVVTKIIPTVKSSSVIGCKSVVYNGKIYTTSTTVIDTTISYYGCDSIYNVANIIVNNITPISNNIKLSGCNSVVYHAVTYTSSTNITDTVKTAQGCDSIYNNVNITVFNSSPITTSNYTSGCDSFTYKNIVYYASTSFRDTIRNMKGCDSIYIKVKITINKMPQLNSINSNSPVMLGDTLKLWESIGGTLIDTLHWMGPNGYNSIYSYNPTFGNATASLAGTYSAFMQNGSCKTTIMSLNVIVNGSLKGAIIHPKGYGIKAVNVITNGVSKLFNSTYSNIVDANSTSIIKATKNNDITKANGISTIDAALVQSFVLGKSTLNSPYKIIAADVNSDGKISALDIVYIKRMILGLDSSFPNNKLWDFVDSSFKFVDTTNPFPHSDSISLAGLTTNKTNQTFIGFKLGDVNWDWNPAVAKPYNNLKNAIELSYSNEALKSTERYIRIPIMVKNFKDIMGMQYTLGFNADAMQFRGIENNLLNIEIGTNHKEEGKLSMLLLDPKNEVKTLEDGTVLMTLVFERTKLSIGQNPLSLNSDITTIEAFDKDYLLHGLVLKPILSNIKSIQEQFVIAPNPTTDGIVNVIMQLNDQKSILFNLYDMNGKLLMEKKLAGEKGENHFILSINEQSKIAAGIYYLKATGLNGDDIKKIIVR